MRAAGVDPSNRTTGLTVLQVDGLRVPRIELMSSVRERGDPVRMALKVQSRLLEVCGHDRCVRVGIERAPPGARSDVEHGQQAAVGWSLGYLCGLTSMAISGAGFQAPVLVDVSRWRKSMCRLSTLWGVPASKPKKPSAAAAGRIDEVTRSASGLTLLWSCGHTSESSILDLHRAKATGCTSCTKRAVLVRDAWKELACELTSAHWPGEYAALVSDARSRARTDRADHELSGVPDACESLWIAASCLLG